MPLTVALAGGQRKAAWLRKMCAERRKEGRGMAAVMGENAY